MGLWDYGLCDYILNKDKNILIASSLFIKNFFLLTNDM